MKLTANRAMLPVTMPTPLDPRCPVARALDIVGERWSLLILRDLVLHGPRKFSDFQASFGAISPNTLSARLKRLEDGGVIERRLYDDRPPRAEYVLTEKGLALRPVLRALRTWGEAHAPRRRASARPRPRGRAAVANE